MLDLSLTTILTVPAFVGFEAILIVNPGPTVPLKTGVAASAGAATSKAAADGERGECGGFQRFSSSWVDIIVPLRQLCLRRSPRMYAFDQLTVNVPCIWLECGSQTKV